MRLIGSSLFLVVPAGVQSPADSAHTQWATRPGTMYHRPGLRLLVGGVIWLGLVIYGLWLATRVVRALEKIADKFQGRP